jgi:hypothetical protein
VGASGDVAASRQATIGRFNPNVNVSLNANLNARVDLALVNATHVFATPVLGGQLAIGMTGLFGRNSTSIDGTLTASLGGLTATRSGSISDSRVAVGYFYNQLTADSGALAILGDNKSSVIGVGPQIENLSPSGDMQGYLNLKGYYEFDAQRRPEGWNVWLTLAISPAAQRVPPASKLVHK